MPARVQNPNELPAHFPSAQQFESVPRSGDGPMTTSQASYLMMLCEETGEVLDDSLSQGEAIERIRTLELATNRGPHAPH